MNSVDLYPNLTKLEKDICACFDGTEFNVELLQVALRRTGEKLDRIDTRYREGIELLERGETQMIRSWLTKWDAQLS